MGPLTVFGSYKSHCTRPGKGRKLLHRGGDVEREEGGGDDDDESRRELHEFDDEREHPALFPLLHMARA